MTLSSWLILSACTPDGGVTRSPNDPPPTDGVVTEDPEDTDVTGSTPGTGTTPSTDGCSLDVVDPGAPVFPATIGTLTVTTATGTWADTNGTTDDTLELCLTATDCYPLRQGKGTQLDTGAVGVWMYAGVGLDRALVDRVELRVGNGGDQWRPRRLDLRFDGEPVHCAAISGVPIGNDVTDLLSWSDPLGLHNGCVSAWDDDELTHGPMVGAVGPSWANLWVRTDATRPVHVQIWPTADPASSRIAGWAYPRAEDDFTASIHTTCLKPTTDYSYQVWVDGAPAGFPGSFTTSPPDGSPAAWSMAFGSCSNAAEQPIFGPILDSEPDLFAFVGDNHYANTTNLDDLRWFYRWSLERFERATMVRYLPIFATWDDHDFAGNDTDGDASGKENALKAFEEYWANPSYGLPEQAGVFYAHRWGDVDLIFLDIRYWRGLDGTMLGQVQHEWLLQQLVDSDATFKLLIDGSQWSFDGGGDSWNEYRADRDELMSGDVHRVEVREIQAPGYLIPEIISSPLALSGSGNCHAAVETELLTCLDEGDYFVTVGIDTTVLEPTITATVHEANGNVVDAFGWTLSALSNP
jgi:alkaline phosphatase D